MQCHEGHGCRGGNAQAAVSAVRRPGKAEGRPRDFRKLRRVAVSAANPTMPHRRRHRAGGSERSERRWCARDDVASGPPGWWGSLRSPPPYVLALPRDVRSEHTKHLTPPGTSRPVAALPLGPAPLPHFGASLPLEGPALPLLPATMPLFSPPLPFRRVGVGTSRAIDAAFFATHAPFRGSVGPLSGMHTPFWCNVGARSDNVGAFTGTRASFRGIVAPESADDGPRTGIDGAFFVADGALNGGGAGGSDKAGAGGCGAARSRKGWGEVLCRASMAGACRDGGPGAYPTRLCGDVRPAAVPAEPLRRLAAAMVPASPARRPAAGRAVRPAFCFGRATTRRDALNRTRDARQEMAATARMSPALGANAGRSIRPRGS